MTRKHAAIGIIISIGAVVVLMAISRPSNAPLSRQAPALRIEATGSTNFQEKELRPISQAPSTPTARRLSAPSFKRLYRDAQDFLPFARAARSAAEAGDADAQFYLSEALSFCSKATVDAAYGVYFVSNGGRLVPAKAVSQEGAVRSEEISTELSDRCGPLRGAIESNENFGSPDDWLAKAADNGSPAAQSTLALRALVESGALPDRGAFGSQIRSGDDARALLIDVAATADPVALWNLGAAQSQFSESYEDRLVNRLALWSISCRSGLDCGSDAIWVQLACQSSECPHNITGPDMIDALAGPYREQVEARARIFGDALQTGTFAQVRALQVPDGDAE